MPRLALTASEEKNRHLIGCIESKMIFFGYSKKDIAERINIPYSTLCFRFRSPETFLYGEIKNIMKLLKFSAEEKSELAKKIF